LLWLKDQLKAGYIRQRGDMSDYTIVGREAVLKTLQLVAPYVVSKRKQITRSFEILDLLKGAQTAASLVKAAEAVDEFAKLNYSKRKIIDADLVRQHLSKIEPVRFCRLRHLQARNG
jgi:hypothetical protein